MVVEKESYGEWSEAPGRDKVGMLLYAVLPSSMFLLFLFVFINKMAIVRSFTKQGFMCKI